jgi:hypothetical protein
MGSCGWPRIEGHAMTESIFPTPGHEAETWSIWSSCECGWEMDGCSRVPTSLMDALRASDESGGPEPDKTQLRLASRDSEVEYLLHLVKVAQGA